jgi:hypothetical protein
VVNATNLWGWMNVTDAHYQLRKSTNPQTQKKAKQIQKASKKQNR